jgi:hypothetical protein
MDILAFVLIIVLLVAVVIVRKETNGLIERSEKLQKSLNKYIEREKRQ